MQFVELKPEPLVPAHRKIRPYQAICEHSVVYIATTDYNTARWILEHDLGYIVIDLRGLRPVVGDEWTEMVHQPSYTKDWYEALAEGIHFLFKKHWPDAVTEDEMWAVEQWADRYAIRPECEEDK
jgi:hypothetical protein